jgi:hypothetical protein
VTGADEERLALRCAVLGKLAIPLEEISGIVFHPPSDTHRRDELIGRLQSRSGQQDVLLLDNGDEVSGRVTAIGEDGIELEGTAGKLKLSIDRIVALAFDPSLVQPPPPKGPRIMIGFNDGSRAIVSGLVVSQGKAQLTLAGNRAAEADADAIVFLQPLGGRVQYLSDLKPTGYKHVPFLELPWEYRLDRNVLGTGLRSQGQLFPRGIGMHSASRMTFPLDGRHKRFAAEAAVDERAGSGGSVVFRVFVDAQQRYASPVVRGGDSPVPVSVEIPRIARSLSLIVDFADRGDELDYADWLNARLEE